MRLDDFAVAVLNVMDRSYINVRDEDAVSLRQYKDVRNGRESSWGNDFGCQEIERISPTSLDIRLNSIVYIFLALQTLFTASSPLYPFIHHPNIRTDTNRTA